MNLVVNGDAEHGPGGTAEPVRSVEGWEVTQGAPALVGYGTAEGYPTPRDPGPPRRGSRFFSGGNSPRTALVQDVRLPAHGSTGRAAVDAGRVRFRAGAWLGGYAGQGDGARLSVEFRDAKGTPLALAVLGPVTPEERDGRTGLVERTAEAALPPGARTARLQLVLTRSGGGTSNDGYADALSLTLVPAPAHAGGRS
ncbi:phosphoesterase [Streptomyces sp. NPDC054796]